MADFYVIPSRLSVGRALAEHLSIMCPGLGWPPSAWPDLAESMAQAASQQPNVYVVFREDLADDVPLAQSLANDFGASADDRIIETTTPLEARLHRAA